MERGLMHRGFHIRRVLLEEGAERFAATSRILERLHGTPVLRVSPGVQKEKPEHLDMDKQSLRLTSFPGEFLKPCPGTKGYICCGYQILHIGTNCPLDCSYCILQAYLNQPSLRVFVNLEEKLAEIGQLLDSQPEKIFRIGTGEFADSLALDHITGWTNALLPFFSSRRNAVLELKTKTEGVEGLFSSKFRNRIVVSWSLNSPLIASREEQGAPGIRQRIEAAKRCQLEGYAVGFHFDPLIEHLKWKEGYLRTLEMMEKHIDPKNVIWVSLGCLRYLPMLKAIIRRRRPDTHILDGEFVYAPDQKMRYFKPIRMEMYAFMAQRLTEWHKDLGLYLCMESDEVWEESLGWSPRNSQGLSRYLDLRATKFFGAPG